MATELDIDDVCADHPKAMAELKILRDGITAVRGLIDSSNGVWGLHLNGDLSTWHELLEYGLYESWLTNFNKAEKV